MFMLFCQNKSIDMSFFSSISLSLFCCLFHCASCSSPLLRHKMPLYSPLLGCLYKHVCLSMLSSAVPNTMHKSLLPRYNETVVLPLSVSHSAEALKRLSWHIHLKCDFFCGLPQHNAVLNSTICKCHFVMFYIMYRRRTMLCSSNKRYLLSLFRGMIDENDSQFANNRWA